MRARYPGPVGGDNLVSPVVCFGYLFRFGIVLFGDDVAVSGVSMGKPRVGLRGMMNACGTMEVSRARQVSLYQRWSTRMGYRVQCCIVWV
jgi:hypothetical protein